MDTGETKQPSPEDRTQDGAFPAEGDDRLGSHGRRNEAVPAGPPEPQLSPPGDRESYELSPSVIALDRLYGIPLDYRPGPAD